MSGMLILGSLVDATNCIDGLAYLLVSLLLYRAVLCLCRVQLRSITRQQLQKP